MLFLTINALIIPGILFTLELFKDSNSTKNVKKKQKNLFRFILYLINIVNIIVLIYFIFNDKDIVINNIEFIKISIILIEIVIIISLFLFVNAILNLVFE